MAVNEKSYACGAAKSAIREIFAYATQRKAEIGADKVFDFSIGNPSTPAPDEIRASIAAALELPSQQLHGYTSANGIPEAREAVASCLRRRFGRECGGQDKVASADDLYLTYGAAASICACLGAIINPGDEVIVVAPYFPEYRVWVEASGGIVVEVPAQEGSFQLDIDAIKAAISPYTKAVIINSPNNPTGAIYPKAALKKLAKVLQEGGETYAQDIYLISDEPYREIAYGVEVPWVPAAYERSLVCYSYSKSMSLPGERIGWVLVPPTNPDHDRLVAAVAGAGRRLGYVCAPSLFQRVLIDCAELLPDLSSYEENRKILSECLDEAGYEYVEPQGAFYLWVRALEEDAQTFCAKARDYELLVVPSDSFGCGGWFRAGYCTDLATVKASLPAWKALAEDYRAAAEAEAAEAESAE